MTDVPLTEDSLSADRIALDYGLRAQVRLLPYALGFFGIGLPLYIWSGVLFLPWWMIGLNLCLFVVLWLAFFLMKPALKAEGATEAQDPARIDTRLRQQWLCGGLWGLGLLTISLNVIDSGPSGVIFLIVCAGAAAGIIFFSSPILIFLLTLGPLAMAGPIIALHSLPPSGGGAQLAHLVTAGLSLALAFGLVLNRHLREHYLLEYRQLKLSLDREQVLKTRDDLSHAQMALMQTLSREVASGMRGLEQTLTQSLGLLVRAPAPRRQVEQALNIVSQLRDMVTTTVDDGTARSGHLDVTPEPLDIVALTADVAAVFAPLARAKGLEFQLLPPAALPESGAVVADPRRVRQILTHMLSNAVTYTASGRVTLKYQLEAGNRLRLEVTDTGPGLDAAELAQAFVPFERILRTSSGHSGTGLGLSLSRTLAGLMGGQLGAESTPGLGSRFSLDLPFDPQVSVPVRAVEADALLPESRETVVTGLTLLLLADDRLESVRLRTLLEQMGHRCLSTKSRPRALSLAQQGRVQGCLIATGAFEDLSEPQNHQKLAAYFQRLRDTQTVQGGQMTILALLPDGAQAEDLARMGVRPLLGSVTAAELTRALIQSDAQQKK